LSGHPIGRLGVPDHIVKGIVFLAADDFSFMTCPGVVVDGDADLGRASFNLFTWRQHRYLWPKPPICPTPPPKLPNLAAPWKPAEP
jgi:hypothetical protein